MIISCSFDKEELSINSLSNQWIVGGNSLLGLKENEISSFLKKIIIKEGFKSKNT
ncbi:hypothetical protein [Borreliella kurtenbachii]|uniref:hypothetical protein n=1 Tax=Borreliella kurtenbachii TaxID=1196056 RepID=UPI003461B5CC